MCWLHIQELLIPNLAPLMKQICFQQQIFLQWTFPL
jgi:hypothetical protein